MSVTAKNIAGLLRALRGKPHPKNYTAAVIAAGGSSTRMGEGVSKQLLMLEGMPILAHTLKAYQECEEIDEIIVVGKEDEVDAYRALCEQYGITKLKDIVKGGKTRQESVRFGSDVVSEKTKYIAIADAARCLITPQEITRVCRAAYLHGAATAATRVHDSIKVGDKNGFIESSPDRKFGWLAQTPQVFTLPAYRTAAYVARDEGYEATDDNQLAEHIGVPVKLVECGNENLKITEPADLLYASCVLRARAEEKARLEEEAAKAAAEAAAQAEKNGGKKQKIRIVITAAKESEGEDK